MRRAIVDAGPLVAWLDRSEKRYEWAGRTIRELEKPLLTCEPVLTEAMYLLRRLPKAQEALFDLIEMGAVRSAFSVVDHAPDLHRLFVKYRDVPMSLADACIVRMAELHERHAVLTLDSDFTIYRKHGKSPLTLIRPD